MVDYNIRYNIPNQDIIFKRIQNVINDIDARIASGGGGGGSSTWGSITGTLSSQTDLQTALNDKASASSVSSDLAGKQNTLVSGTNIKTVNGTSLLGSGNVDVSPTLGAASITVPRTNGGYLQHTEVITDGNVSPTSKILLSLGGGSDTDENEAEMLDIGGMSATAGTGNFTVMVNFLTRTSGIVKLNYMVGA